MNIIKSFTLDRGQLKEALNQWLNGEVLKNPCEIEELETHGYGASLTITVVLKEPEEPPAASAFSTAPPPAAFPPGALDDTPY